MYNGTALHRLFLVAATGIGVVCALSLWTDLTPAAANLLYDFNVISAATLVAIYDTVPTQTLSTLVLLVAGVLFLLWLGRSRRHLIDFDTRPEYSPGWTVGAWIIPLANFILPALVVADIARNSTTDVSTGPTRRGLLTLVWTWWGGYTIHSVGAVATRLPLDPIAADVVVLVCGVAYLGAGVLAVLMMRAVGRAQAVRAADVTPEPDPAHFPTFTVDEIRPA